MKVTNLRSVFVTLLLLSCSPALRPEDEAERDYRQATQTSEPKKALELMDRVLSKFERADYLVYRAMLHQSLRNTDAAIADWTAAIRLRKNDPALHFNRGLAYESDRRPREALADYSEAIRIHPEYPEALLYRARLLKGADAARDIAEARRVGGTLADGFYNEGVRAITAGDGAEAEKNFRFALDLKPDHGRAHVAMARIHMERRMFADAAVELDRAIETLPGDASLYYHRGNARLGAGRGEEALTDFAKAVELDAEEASYVAARGLALHRVRGDLPRARANFDEALKLDQNCHAAFYNRGLLNHEQSLLKEAEQDLRKALQIRASPEGCLALGRVLHDRGEYDKALSLYAQAIDLYKDPEIQKTLREESERTRKAKVKK
jgi:tetratricopeptide (TPR) repeat protein